MCRGRINDLKRGRKQAVLRRRHDFACIHKEQQDEQADTTEGRVWNAQSLYHVHIRMKRDRRDAKEKQPQLYQQDIDLEFLCFFLSSISWLGLGFHHSFVLPCPLSI